MGINNNSIKDIKIHGFLDGNNYHFNDDTNIRQCDDEHKAFLKNKAIKLFNIAKMYCEVNGLPDDVTYINLNDEWKSVTIYNESNDVIRLYMSDDYLMIDSRSYFIDGFGTFAKGVINIDSLSSFNETCIDIKLFKERG